MHGRLLAILFSALVLAGPARAEDTPELEARADALVERLEQAREQVGGDAAEPALEHARRALSTAATARREGRMAAAARALSIADAALILADRLAAQRRARLALEDAREREREAIARAEAARHALSRALEDRASALAPDGESAAVEPAAAEPDEGEEE